MRITGHITRLYVVTQRNHYHAGGANTATSGKHAGEKYDIVRRKVEVCVPSVGSSASAFAAQMESEGNGLVALRQLRKGCTLEAQDTANAWDDLRAATSGKISDDAAWKHAVANMTNATFAPLFAAGKLDEIKATAKGQLAEHREGVELESTATEEDAKVFTKQFGDHFDKLEGEQAARNKGRIGQGG